MSTANIPVLGQVKRFQIITDHNMKHTHIRIHTHALPCCQVPLSQVTFPGHDSWGLRPFCQQSFAQDGGVFPFSGLQTGRVACSGKSLCSKIRVNFRFNSLGCPRPFSTPELTVVNRGERFHPCGPQVPQLLRKLHLLKHRAAPQTLHP